MKRLLDVVDIGGRTEYWWLHTGPDGTDRISIETIQDVEPILDANKRAYNDAPDRFGKGDLHKVAEIPVTVIEEICRLKQIKLAELVANKTDRAQKIWRELLNSNEFLFFRTRPGRVAMTPFRN